MLPVSATWLFVLGVGIVLIMPGPTNTLLAAAGLRRGVQRAAWLTCAELAGYVVSITLWGSFLAHAGHSLSWLSKLVRIASCLYVAYLALRMWRTAMPFQSSPRATIGWRTLFIATLLNPKAVLFAGSIFPAAAFASWPAYLGAIGIFTTLLIPIGLLWTTFGAALGSGRLAWIHADTAQRFASIVLGTFSVSLAWSLFHQGML